MRQARCIRSHFLNKTTFLIFVFLSPSFVGFLKKETAFLFVFKEKHKNSFLNYFYCIMQHQHFQNYLLYLITCYTYYGIQNWG